MKRVPSIMLFGSLLLAANVSLAEPNAYVDALSSEAGETDMNADKAAAEKGSKEEAEPTVQPKANADLNALGSKVSNQLEKLLTGTSAEDVKQEDLANIVSDAVKEGSDIDEIQGAVSAAMAALQGKEDTEIKPEVLEFAAKSLSNIVGASKDIAQGDPNDPYIQQLNSEVSDMVVVEGDKPKKTADKGEEAKTQVASAATTASSTDEGSEAKPASDQAEATTTNADSSEGEAEGDSKTDTTAASDATESAPATRTIVVLKGESLSKIASKIYGSGSKYTLLFEANRDKLSNPDKINVGQILVVPPLPAE